MFIPHSRISPVAGQSLSVNRIISLVTVVEQFADAVYIKVRQHLDSEAASAVLLEYEIDDWIRLVARFAERQSTTQNLFNRIDRGRSALEFRFRY